FVWVPSQGGPLNVIAPSGSRDVAHFRMDTPDRIYAYSPVEGLVSFRWDGTDAKSHLRVMGTPAMGGTPHEDEHQVLPRRVFPFAKPQVTLTNDGMEPSAPAPPAGLVLIAPRGDYALAQVGNDIYSVLIPQIGGDAPVVSVANVAGAPVPMRKLSDIGGEFPSWSADGERVHWAIGNALVTYDLAIALAMEDSVKEVERAR